MSDEGTEDKGYFDGDEWKDKKPDDEGGGAPEGGGEAPDSGAEDVGASDPDDLLMEEMEASAINQLAAMVEILRQQLLLATQTLNAANVLVDLEQRLIEKQREIIAALESEKTFLYALCAYFGAIILVLLVLLIASLMI